MSIKIPQQARFSQTNKSDLFGNIYYTKSINFNEPGYLKLQDRSLSIYNRELSSDFNHVVSFGRAGEGKFEVPTQRYSYDLTLNDSIPTFVKNTTSGFPTLDATTYGKYWINRYHVSNNTKVYYFDTSTWLSGSWTDTGMSLTTAKPHPMAVFEKAGTFMVANGNAVIQVNTSYAVGSLAQLSISTEYEIIGMAYNNNILGIITRPSALIAGQNKEAVFITWDGSASSANAMYGVGSDSCVSIIPYKSSFAVLTRAGELKYFNGGGFDTLATLPAYNSECIWGDLLNLQGYGDMMKVDGELIYINVNSEVYTPKLDTYLENMPGGIWCYDPEVGLYQKQSASLSQATVLYVAQASVNTTTNTMTVYTPFSYPTSPTIPTTGNPVKVLDSTIGGLIEGKIYFIIKSSSTEFKLATTKQNAIDLIAIDLTSQGGTSSSFLTFETKDYGQAKSHRPGAVGLMGYYTNLYSDFIFGSELNDTNSGTNYPHLNISVAGFKNIGYFVTSKINSKDVEDNIQKLFIKYRPLKTDDVITIKYKNKDFENIPSYANCTVVSSSQVTTTSNISEAYNYTDELELEILNSSGAGQMTKISSITESSGTYTINFTDELDGLTASDSITVKIDNWKILDTITNADSENWKEIALTKNSKWTKFKVVLEGSDITLEELSIDNIKHI